MHSCTIPEALTDRAAELARLRLLARKVALVHGGHKPHMTELASVVSAIADRPEDPVTPVRRDQLTALTDRFQPWPEACGSVRALFAGLAKI